MIVKLITLKPLTDVPDNAQYSVLDSEGRLVTASESSSVTATATPTGSEITIEYDLPALSPGSYTVIFKIGESEYNQPTNVAEPDKRNENGWITTSPVLDLDVPAATGTFQFFRYNTLLDEGVVTGSHIGPIDEPIRPSFDSYNLIVTNAESEIADIEVFYLNPMMLKAIRELQSIVDRLQRQLRLDALEFTDIDYLRALNRGKDRFNGLGPMTEFTMLNAQGPIRNAWLTLSSIEVLRVRSLEEGLTNYSYEGSSISLSTDTRASLDEFLLTLETRILDEIKPLKMDLARMSIVGGDGSQSRGSRFVGSVGIGLGPASSFGGLFSPATTRLPRIL